MNVLILIPFYLYTRGHSIPQDKKTQNDVRAKLQKLILRQEQEETFIDSWDLFPDVEKR